MNAASGTGSARFDAIQVLRFVAALMVVVMHASHYAAERISRNAPIFSNGSAGVDIFFVISGFVMIMFSQPLIVRADGWKLFAKRRIVRIVPLYWALLLVKLAVLLLAPQLLNNTAISAWQVVSSFLFLPSYNHEGVIAPILVVGWTLNFEMFFYCLLTLAMAWRLPLFRFVGVVFAVLCIAAIFRAPTWPAGMFYFDPIVLEFAFGMLIARAFLNGLQLSRVSCNVLISVGFIALLPVWQTAPDLLRPLVWGVPAALIVLGAAGMTLSGQNRLARSLLFLGNASYALYLIHPLVGPLPALLLARLGVESVVLAVCASIVVSLVAAMLVYTFAERPITALLRNRFGLTATPELAPK